MPDLVDEVRRRIAEAADPGRATQMRAYMKSAMPYRGVTSVPLRGILREVLSAHPLPDRVTWEATVLELWDGASYREERYAAVALAGHRSYRSCQDLDTLQLYRHLVRTGTWWDFVANIASHHVGAILRAWPSTVSAVIREWALDEDLWVRRTSLLSQLHSKDATNLALLGFVLDQNLEGSLHGHEFFIRKACGWALRQYARTDPGWVRAFIDGHDDRMSPLTRREALKRLG